MVSDDTTFLNQSVIFHKCTQELYCEEIWASHTQWT